ncbi:MAG: alpha/beta fold hydrolase [Deltaproteobacteria bacterium]|nr:alpha/beta fold hydrolase [Deltaproteobacteria bacterium]
MKDVVVFDSQGETLTGILTSPAEASAAVGTNEARPDVGIVFGDAGIYGRLGTTIEFPYYCDVLASRGYPSLRFDSRGRGESTGPAERHLFEVVQNIAAAGSFVPDFDAALDAFRTRVQPRKMIAGGLSASAFSALYTGAKRSDVSGVILLGLPVYWALLNEHGTSKVLPGAAYEHLKEVTRKNRASFKAWRSLLSDEAQRTELLHKTGVLMRGGWQKALAISNQKLRVARDRVQGVKDGKARRKRRHIAMPPPDFNPRILVALDALMARRTPTLVVYGEDDWLADRFQRYFVDCFWTDDPAYEELIEIHRVPHANHVFSMRKWQDELLEIISGWIERRLKRT